MPTGLLDTFSGLSGDMTVAALLDSGAPFDALQTVIASLGLEGVAVSIRRKTVSGIAALKFDVEVSTQQPERTLGEIRSIIDRATALNDAARRTALDIFRVLADAEAKVHRTTPDRVHFHEVGAADSIIDIVAAAWGFDALGITELFVTPIPLGQGFAHSRHGIIPVPAPATIELLTGFPVRIGDGPSEMVTPTSAAIVKALARPLSPEITLSFDKIGYGAGTKDFADRPNLLRLMVGERTALCDHDQMLEIRANIDDMNPQLYDHLVDRILEAGARDVTLTPTIMKKGRPAITVAILAEPALRDRIAEIMFAESSTIGIRYEAVSRIKLAREFREVATQWGPVRIKISRAGATETITPEFDDCRRIAREHAVALRIVLEEANAAARGWTRS